MQLSPLLRCLKTPWSIQVPIFVALFRWLFGNVYLHFMIIHKTDMPYGCIVQITWGYLDTRNLMNGNVTMYYEKKHCGKSPVGAYKRVEALQFFSWVQNNSYRIIKKGWNVDLVDISSVWQFIWRQLTTILLVYHLSILRYFQFNEVSQGWRCPRIRIPTDQVPCKTIGISNLHCALHTHNANKCLKCFNFWNRRRVKVYIFQREI